MRNRRAAAIALIIAGLAVTASGCGGSAKAASARHLDGLFRLTAGQCTTAHDRPTGSYLTVISAAQGRAAVNPHGGCVNPDFTVLTPGKDGGITTGRFQAQPTPVFDAKRNSTADRIVEPVQFGPFRLGLATSSLDEQDAPDGAPAYPAPLAIATGNQLQMDLRSLVLTYAGRADTTCKQGYGFGCWDLGSKSASGTYDPATHRFVLDWFAGESFSSKGDSIEVHLEGTFEPTAAS